MMGITQCWPSHIAMCYNALCGGANDKLLSCGLMNLHTWLPAEGIVEKDLGSVALLEKYVMEVSFACLRPHATSSLFCSFCACK